jgi:hypothetical protein
VAKNQSIKNNKLCETKPNFKKPKMNLTPYLTKNCKINSEFLPMEKQSQTNPKQSQFRPAVRGTKPKQTQSKPNPGG